MAEDNIRALPARRFNIVQLIFFILLIYMVVITGKYLSKEKVKITEVVEGSLSQNHTYAGLVLRDEEVLVADTKGFLKCYANDGTRLSKGSIVYAIDKTGRGFSGDNSVGDISDEEYRSIRKYLNHFSTSYNGQNYSNVYGLKNQLQTVLYGVEQNGSIEENREVKVIKTPSSGLVYYSLDGLEGKTPGDFTRAFLENISYRPIRAKSGDVIESGTNIAKIIHDDTWNILVPITEDDAAYYQDKKRATLYLNDVATKVRADIEILEDSDHKKIAVLTLDQYMASYASDRIISVRLEKELLTGLKVPNTGIVSRDLFVIPVAAAEKDENGRLTIIRKTPDKEKEYETLTPDISYSDKKSIFLDESVVEAGDILAVKKEDGRIEDYFTVGEKKTLRGVYNVNKGYAVFAVVEILEEDDAYSIVKGGSTYGLSVYDHIVLNATTVSEDELIY